MAKNKINIGAFFMENSPEGQGVKAATDEQVNLFKTSKSINVIKNPKQLDNIDVAHFHTIEPKEYLKLKKCKRKKIPTVCHVHFIPDTLDGSIKLNKLFFKILKTYTKKFYKKADNIVVVNPIFIDRLVAFGIDRDKITYIPNFVSNKTFYKQDKKEVAKTRKEFKLEDKFTVLGVGQVQARKGVLDFAKVAKANPDIQFVWAGGFSFGKITDGYKELKELMENPTSDNLKFIGIVKRSRMNEIYNMADVLFMPSYNELFPMAILEASNTQKPLVLRNLDLYEDILLGGYLKGADNKAFTRHIKKISTDKDAYKKASEKSYEIAKFYSPSNVLKMWEKYYKERV